MSLSADIGGRLHMRYWECKRTESGLGARAGRAQRTEKVIGVVDLPDQT
jgi:hypothetical protein